MTGSVWLLPVSRDQGLFGIDVRASRLSTQLDRWPEKLSRLDLSVGGKLDVCEEDIC